MNLERIDIEKFAAFENFKWSSSFNTQKFSQTNNIIFGWNGSGKSSFSRLLANFQSNYKAEDSEEVHDLEKEDKFSLLLTGDQAIQKIDSDNIENSDTKEKLKNKILVFNKKFVDENIDFTKCEANLFLMIGKASIDISNIRKDLNEKQVEFDQIKDQHQEKVNELKNKVKKQAKEISNFIAVILGIPSYENKQAKSLNVSFLERKIDELIDKNDLKAKIDNIILSYIEVGDKLKKLSKTDGLSKKDPYAEYDLDSLVEAANKIIEKKVDSIKIDRLNKVEIERWVSEGINLHENKDRCYFCDSPLEGKILNDLKTFFSGEVDKIKTAIENIKSNNAELFLESFLISPIPINSLHPSLESEEIDNLNSYIEEYNKLLESVVKSIRQGLDSKLNSPVNYTEAINIKEENLSRIANLIFSINTIIEKHNELMDNTAQERDENLKNYVSLIANQFYDERKELLEANLVIEQKQQNLESYKKTKALKINELLAESSGEHIAAQEINSTLNLFLGREDIKVEVEPSSPDDDSETKFRLSRNGRLAKRLSEGEKTALALSFFMVKCREENFDFCNSIIVIDDPVSSLDSSLLYSSASYLVDRFKMNETDTTKRPQIFLLSHNTDFLYCVSKLLNSKKNESYYYEIFSKIVSDNRQSDIRKLSQRFLQNEYEFLIDYLVEYLEKKELDPYLLANPFRKIMEIYFTSRCPNSELSKAVSKVIEAHKKGVTLDSSKNEILETIKISPVKAIEKFCQGNSHLKSDGYIGTVSFNESDFERHLKNFIKYLAEFDPIHIESLPRLQNYWESELKPPSLEQEVA